MQFGYFTLSDNRYPDNTRSAEDFLKDIFAEALYAEKVGLNSAWIGEHHFNLLGVNASPLAILAQLAGATTRLRLAPAVTLLPVHHPLHVAETREKARAEVAYGLADFCKYFTDVATFPIVPADIADPVEYLTSSGLACIGTPDDCIRHFERLWLGSNGGFGAVLLLSHNWADWEATKRSYELMARYVHPHFQRQSNTLRVASYDTATAQHETAGAESQKAVEKIGRAHV